MASYVHQYKQGIVICFCVFGDDIIYYDQRAQYFLVQSTALLTGPSVSVLSLQNTTTYLLESVVVASSGTVLIMIASAFGLSYYIRRKKENL